MGTPRRVELGISVVFFQMLTLVVGDISGCVPGFEADLLVFEVDSVILHKDRTLGKVGFDDCSGLKHFVLNCSNRHFQVDSDGSRDHVLKMNKTLTLHGGYKNFSIHAWDSQGKNITVPICVLYEPAHNRLSHGHQDQLHSKKHGHSHNHHNHRNHNHHNRNHRNHHNHNNRNHHNHNHRNHQGDNQHHIDKTVSANHHQHHITAMDFANQQKQQSTEASSIQSIEAAVANPGVMVLHFPKSTRGLKRQKRAWVIPPINYPENDRGPFPKAMVQIRSDGGEEMPMLYSVTGPGADLPPVELFTIDKKSGWLFVNQPLDREEKPFYTLQAHAVYAQSGKIGEEPMDIRVVVIDQNDNKPLFTQDTYLGQVPESSTLGFVVCTVNATDSDEPNNDNSDVRYVILNQDPKTPADNLFAINPVSGAIRVNAGGLDREQFPKYTLEVQAADLRGEGLSGRTKVILTVTDSNDNAPAFQKKMYEAAVPENKAGAEVVRMTVTDGDEAHSPAWNAKFTIVDGDPTGLFSVETSTVNKQEGIIKTAKALDFELNNKYTLLVAVENDVPFATRLPTATATVTVNVEDVNEAPIFNPEEKFVVKPEDLAVGSEVVAYIATDPDTARKQTVSYKILRDPAGWLNINKQSGLITVKSVMDRESHFITVDKYSALIGAVDDDDIPATGTGTLIIQLQDVNDNFPTIDERVIKVCNKDSAPQMLTVTDKDGVGHAAPFSVLLQGLSKQNWTAKMNDTKTGIILTLAQELPRGDYSVVLTVSDTEGKKQDSTLQATVCDCKGVDVVCSPLTRAAGMGLPVILGILGAILLLLLLVLLLLMFIRRRGGEKKEPLLPEDDVRDNIYYYDEEGGGEDDQDFDLSVLHRGLDNRPEVFRNDVMPTYMTRPEYRPRPANPQDIGNFIDDNLKAADNDPTAPPYDSLLVFDYEGGGSDAGSLSSLNSDSSGDQDYDCFSEWGPRFKKLADMYGGGDDDDML